MINPTSISVCPRCLHGLHWGWWTNTDWQRERGPRALPPLERTDSGCALPSFPHSNMAKVFDIITQPSSPLSSSPITPSLFSPPPPTSSSSSLPPSSPVQWWPGRMEKLSASLSEITWSPLALPLDAVVSKFRLPTLVRLAHGKTRNFLSPVSRPSVRPVKLLHAEDVSFVSGKRTVPLHVTAVLSTKP